MKEENKYKEKVEEVAEIEPMHGMMPNMGTMPQMGMMPNMGMMPQMGMMPNMGMMPQMGMMPNMGMMPQMDMMPNMGMMPQMDMMPNMGQMPTMCCPYLMQMQCPMVAGQMMQGMNSNMGMNPYMMGQGMGYPMPGMQP